MSSPASSRTVANPPNAYPIRAVERVCDILDMLQRSRDGATLADIAAVTELPKSSAFRYLAALEARRYVRRDDHTGLYRVGIAFQPHHTRQLETLLDLARAPLERLRDETGETTNLGTLEGSEIVHDLVVESRHMMRLAARVGDRGSVHSTAMGKAMVAELPPGEVDAILAATEMQRFTPHTITSVDGFNTALGEVRRVGYALDERENQVDGRCVAVALQGLPFLAAISVSAPAERLGPEKVPAVVKQLRRVALQLVRDFLAQS